MSSDDGIDYHSNNNNKNQQQPAGLSNTSSSAAGTQTNCSSTNQSTNRRKSSITYSHIQSQGLSSHKDNNNDGSSTSGNDNHAKSMHVVGVQCSGVYNSMASPSRFGQNEAAGFHVGSRLSIHPDRYDENITCCLPPPSPAPNSDRFVMGMPSPSPTTHHYPDHKFSVHHRSMSPSSRYRSSLPDRYRDISPKCDRFVPSPHYLANSSPLASSDSYAYLSATVHTPVKRYVPIPPLPSDIYTEPSIANGYISSSHLPQPQQQQQQQQQQTQQQTPRNHSQNSTLPYRYRMKCCSNDQSIQQPIVNQTISTSSVADHYATPPRVRPLKCPPSQSSAVPTAVVVTGNGANGGGPSSGGGGSSTGVVSGGGGGNNSRQSSRNCSNDYIQRTPSVEYIGPSSGRVVTPVNTVMNEANNGTCLHCSTMRRTTGVHQTTQTTGPISPVPQPLSISSTSNTATHSDAAEQTTSSPSPPASSSIISLQQSTQQQPSISPIPHNQNHDESILNKQSKMSHQTQQQPQQQHQQSQQQSQHSLPSSHHNVTAPRSLPQQQQVPSNSSSNVMLGSTLTLQRTTAMPPLRQQIQQHQQQRMSRKQRIKEHIRREMAKFFGVDCCSEEHERTKWADRQKRLAIRRFGQLKPDADLIGRMGRQHRREQHGDRPDILPAQTTEETEHHRMETEHRNRLLIERKSSVPTMIWNGISYIVQILSKNQPRPQRQWSRSFAPGHVMQNNDDTPGGDMFDGLTPLHEDELFFDSPNNCGSVTNRSNNQIIDQTRQIYIGERVHGWRTRATDPQLINQRLGYRGTRISSQLLDGVLDNSRRPLARGIKLLRPNELDDRYDHRPYFTYWINTVQILILVISLICYGVGPIGIGMEQKSGQVLVTSLSLQQVQHQEPRNVWIGPRGDDLVHLGAKFAACMRRDTKIMDVIAKTRRQERETACCIRNDDSGCVQSSQADCSVRGLWPTKSISTWKKWSPGESGPGGRISGSVCGLDPKYCDAPASVAPYEWPDDITKWPICRKTNSFSQRFRFKDHTAEHMVCEVIGHPCCTGVYGECRITTREFCDFVNGYFHEEASLCSQVSCLNDVCGMFPFISPEVPDQFYRLFTSLCLHAGVLHLAITVAFQHIFLADLERLIGPIRTAIVYIGSGVAGNLTSAIFVPYKPEVGPLASLAGVVSSLSVLLMLIHWKQLKKPHMALIKLILIVGSLFGMGTLPWQQNFIGLIAGVVFGTALTLALVPFVSITKYGRHSKINLIWTCMLLHFTIYTAMFIIFYIFPMAFTSISIGGDGATVNNAYSNGYSVGGNIVACDKGSCTGSAGTGSGGGARINA